MSTSTSSLAWVQETPEPEIELQLSQTLDDCNDCLNRGKFAEALQALDRAVDLAPSNPDMLNHRGRLLLFLKHPGRAHADFEQALRINPEHAMANAGLARFHFESGAHDKAQAHAQRSLTNDPQNQEAAAVLSALKKLIGEKSAEARRRIQDFYAKARNDFATVEPPPLSEWHLKNSRIVPHREGILDLMPKGGVCAEIGTQTGDFARQILARLNPAKLHIFDIDFTPFDRPGFETLERTGIVELHQGDSSTCLGAMTDRTFDFIYIDGDHSYEGVVKDLAAAVQKVKEDGWIVCNDYTIYSPLEQIKYGVYRAVNEFCWRHGFEIVYLGLHHWSYHDVALRRMKPEDTVLAGAPPNPTLASSFASAKLAGETITRNPRFNARLANPGLFRGRVMAESTMNSGALPAAALQDNQVAAAGSPAMSGVIETIGRGDEMFTGDRTHYFGVGKSALHGIQTALAAVSRSPMDMRKILDLPCGHGRVMRHLKAVFPHAQITACDLNHAGVDFCAQTFGAAPVYSHASPSQIALPDRYDLIWSGSLLTHLRDEPCAEFVRLFSRLANPGSLIIFTLHGRWVERSLATRRYTYGLKEENVVALLKEYYETGFGYADYPGMSGYGISVASPAYVLAQLVSLPDLKLVSYHEKGWDNHQDIVCLQKQAPNEPLG